jgi:hypothetical protein
VQFGPHPGTGTKDQQPYGLSAVAQRHRQKTGSAVLASLLFIADNGTRSRSRPGFPLPVRPVAQSR